MENINKALYYNGLGHQYKVIDNIKEALLNYDKAVKLDSNNMAYYYNRACCYRLLEQYDEAVKDYTIVINSDSLDAVAYYERGICYNRTGSYQKALDDFNNAIKIKPSINTDCYLCRAVAYCGMSDKNGAIRAIEQVLRIDPNNISAKQMLDAVRRC